MNSTISTSPLETHHHQHSAFKAIVFEQGIPTMQKHPLISPLQTQLIRQVLQESPL